MKLLLTLLLLTLTAKAEVCRGDDPCKACKDCSRCAYCTSGKGSCGVLRDQNAAQEKARQAKRAKLRKP